MSSLVRWPVPQPAGLDAGPSSQIIEPPISDPVVGGTEITAAAEDWTGSDGSAWDTGRWETSAGSGTIDIQSNEGRMVSPLTAFAANNARALTGTLTDAELLVRFRYAQIPNADLWVMLRGDDNVSPVANAYIVVLNQGGAGNQALYKRVASTTTFLGDVNTGTLVVNIWYWLRFRTEGTTISAKVWQQGTIEPAAWGFTTTDGDVASGVPRLRPGSDGTPTACDARLDHFRLGNLVVGTTATAETAPVTAAAQDASVAVVAMAETAAVTAAAQDAVAGVGPVAETATATAAAQDATAVTTTGTVAVAETALVTAAAQDATVAVAAQAVGATVTVDADAGVSQAVAVEAETAIVTAAAQDATAVVVSGGVATAQTATVTAAAQDATIAVVAMAQTATVTAAAVDAVAAPAPAAETALVTAGAADATIAVAQPAGTATITAAAQDATASTVATTTADAETALVTVAAQDASVAVVAMAQTATVTVAAQNATFQRFTDAVAQTAQVTVTAVDPAVAIGVLAETAAVVAAAQDATAFIPPPVPPPRWVEGGPTASGQVEGVLVGAGIVEGGASL